MDQGLGRAHSIGMPDLGRLGVVRSTMDALACAEESAAIHEAVLEGLRQLGEERTGMLLSRAGGLERVWHGIPESCRDALLACEPISSDREGGSSARLLSVLSPSLSPARDALEKDGVGSVVVVPLLMGEEILGQLLLCRAAEGLPESLPFLELIAAATAFAIDRRRAINALSAERRLFTGGPTMIFKWKNQAGWPVEYVSPNVYAQLGYAAKDLISGLVAYATLVHPEDLERVGREVAAATSEGLPFFEQQYRIRHADGRYRTIYDFTVPVRVEEVTTHFQGYVLDITEREAAQSALRHAERRLAEVQRLESLGLLAGGIAHDFNNLLVGILGNASLALTELPEDSPARGTIETLKLAGQRAADLTRQLLAYSGKGTFLIEAVDITALVREAGELLSTVVARTATLHYELATDLTPVDADATQIRQVVMNLLTNASDALGGQPGNITLSVRAHTATERSEDLSPGRYVVIEVRDDGVGMDAETKKRIFEPFFTTKFHGRGLGMAAVLGAAKSHGGAIRIESEKGRGTIATVILPAARTRRVAPSPAPPPVRTGKKGAVSLVVADEKFVRNLTARALALEDFVVYAAENGAVALEQLEQHPDIEVVLLDLTMPVLSGEATLACIRERWPGVQVILTSGYNAESTSAVADADAFIQKPYLTEDLVALVRARLGR